MVSNPIIKQWLTQPGGLVAQLDEVREAAGYDQKQLAERLGVHPSTISRVLSGQQVPAGDLVTRWCRACGAEERINELQAMRARSRRRHLPWRDRFAHGFGGVQEAYNALHDQADSVWAWSSNFIPGPLQTESYARAIMQAAADGARIPGDVEEGVQQRMIRTQFVGDGIHSYRFAMTEAVLMGGPIVDEALHAEQVEHLRRMSTRPNTAIVILPFRHGQTVIASDIFEIVTVDQTPFVLSEHATGETEWTSAADVEMYIDLFARIWDAAIPIRQAV